MQFVDSSILSWPKDKDRKEAVIASQQNRTEHTWDVKTEVRPLIDATFPA